MINELMQQYQNNLNKIKEIESQNQEIVWKLIDNFLKDNSNTFILRNVSINVIVLSTINKDWFEKLNQIHFLNNQIRNKQIAINWNNNEFFFVFNNHLNAKNFIKQYNLHLDKNYNAIDRVGEGNPSVDNYNKLFNYLTE